MKNSSTEQPLPEMILKEINSSPEFYGLIGLVVCLLIIAKILDRNPKHDNVIARGSRATPNEIKNGAILAMKQMRERKRAKIGLSCGTPRGSLLEFIDGEWKYTPTYDEKIAYLANGEGGFLAIGSPGSGKTFSFLLPSFQSFLLQGFPAIFYDIKYSTHTPEDPCPSAQVAGFAKRLGYDVFIMAPGLNSHCLNPLDLIESPTDSVNARQLAIALYQNTSPEALKSGNPFFSKTTQGFLQGLFMMAKLTDYPDLLTVRYLSKVKHLEEVIESPRIPQAIKLVFDTAVAAMSVGETWGGVQATCSNLLSALLMPEILPSICGKSTIPLTLDGRQLVIFGMNGRARDVVSPILASVIHVMTNVNLLQPRKLPYGVWVDELGSIFLPEIDEWPNQHRGAGLCLWAGIQSPEILKKRYPGDAAGRIMKGLNTHAVFRLNDVRDAENYCKATGTEDITFDTKSKTKAKNGGSSGDSGHRQTRNIIDPHEITQYPEGKCLLFSPGTKSHLSRVVPKRIGHILKARARVPYEAVIDIPEHDLKSIQKSVEDYPSIQAQLKRDSKKTFGDSEFKLRDEHVSALFPIGGDGPPTNPQLHDDLKLFQQINSVVAPAQT